MAGEPYPCEVGTYVDVLNHQHKNGEIEIGDWTLGHGIAMVCDRLERLIKQNAAMQYREDGELGERVEEIAAAATRDRMQVVELIAALEGDLARLKEACPQVEAVA